MLSLSPRRAPWWLVVLAQVALAAAPLHAQAALGFGDDATIPPAGTVRAGFQNIWTRFDQRFVSSTGASIDTRSQIRRTPIALELGLTNRLSLGVTVPSVGTRVTATYFADTAPAFHADSQAAYAMSGIGDATASLKLVWLRTFPDSERYRPRGVRLRSAITVTAQAATGLLPHTYTPFGIGTGTRANAIEVGSQWDLMIGPSFWVSAAGRYRRYQSDTRVVRVAPPGDPFSTDVGPVEVSRHLAPMYQLEVTPRVALGEYFAIGVQYQYRHNGRATYAGTNDIPITADSTLHLDASVLEPGSDLTEQRVGFGVVYSSVSAHAVGRGNYPFEITFQHFRTVQISGGRVKPSEYLVSARFYVRLWGGKPQPAAVR
ncbi:MAG: hypothetical protein IRY91_01020 [Gemmatimonadaceae bacterium]|nr:hypothetical protein [Gemmatimonadaceae bacterium]